MSRSAFKTCLRIPKPVFGARSGCGYYQSGACAMLGGNVQCPFADSRETCLAGIAGRIAYEGQQELAELGAVGTDTLVAFAAIRRIVERVGKGGKR